MIWWCWDDDTIIFLDMFDEKEEDDLFVPTSGMFGSGRGLFDVKATTGGQYFTLFYFHLEDLHL